MHGCIVNNLYPFSYLSDATLLPYLSGVPVISQSLFRVCDSISNALIIYHHPLALQVMFLRSSNRVTFFFLELPEWRQNLNLIPQCSKFMDANLYRIASLPALFSSVLVPTSC